jgi:hypothetical protein
MVGAREAPWGGDIDDEGGAAVFVGNTCAVLFFELVFEKYVWNAYYQLPVGVFDNVGTGKPGNKVGVRQRNLDVAEYGLPQLIALRCLHGNPSFTRAWRRPIRNKQLPTQRQYSPATNTACV